MEDDPLPTDTLDASAILDAARQGQSRPLQGMDEGDLKQALDRARERNDEASRRMIEEEITLREQEPTAPASSTATEQQAPRPQVQPPEDDPDTSEQGDGLDATTILQDVREETAGDGAEQEPSEPQPSTPSPPTARRSSTGTAQQAPSESNIEEAPAEGPPIEGEGQAGPSPEEKRPEESAFESALEYLSAPARGAAEMTASIVEGTSTMRPSVRVPLTEEEKQQFPELAQMQARQSEAQRQQIEETLEGESTQAELAEGIRAFAERRLPDVSRAEREGFVMRTLEGLGSTVPFLAGGAVSGPLSLPVMGALGIAGSEGELISDARRTRRRAEAQGQDPSSGASAEDVQEGTGLAGIAGATEALPLQSALSRAVPSPLRRKALEAAIGGLEEASQETAGTVLRNLAAQEYDENRDPLEGVREAAETGGAVGFLLNAITTLAGGRRGATPDGRATEEANPAADGPGGQQTDTEPTSQPAASTDQAGGAPQRTPGRIQETQQVDAQSILDEVRRKSTQEQEPAQRQGGQEGATPENEGRTQDREEAREDVLRRLEEAAPEGAETADASGRRPLADMDQDVLENALQERQEAGDEQSVQTIRRELQLREQAERQEEIEDQADAQQVQEELQEAAGEDTAPADAQQSPDQGPEQGPPPREEPEPRPEDDLFEALSEATPEQLSALQQTTDNPAVLEEIQQARVVQQGQDRTTAVQLPDVDPESVDIPPQITEAVRQVEEQDAQPAEQEGPAPEETSEAGEAARDNAEEAQPEEETDENTDTVPEGPQVDREPQPAREAVTGLPRDERQILEEIARTSDDPAEIALSYRQAREIEETQQEADDLAAAIRDVGRLQTESYENVVGSNVQRDEGAVRLRFLSREGKPLDRAAQEISEELGREVDVQEVADKVREMGTRRRGRTTADRLADRFEEVTGRPITERRADQAIQEAVDEETSARPSGEDPSGAVETDTGPVTAPFQRTRRLSRVAELRSERGEGLSRGDAADGERIQPRPERTSEDVSTFRDMLEDLQEDADIEIQRSQLPRAAAGMYEAGGGATIVRTPNDVDTAVHEIAHAIDDRYGVLEEWAGEDTSPLDDELVPQFSQHGSGQSDPDAEEASPTYERAEGFAEWLRAYTVNPQAARERAPRTFEQFQETVPEDVRTAIEDFGERLRNYAAAVEEGDPQATLANVETDLDPPGLLESMKERFDFLLEDRGVGDTWMDRLAVEAWDEMRIVMKTWDSAQAMKGRDLSEIDVDDNFRVLARLFNGLDTRVMRYFESGLEDMSGNRVTDGGFDWILEPLDTSSKQQLEQDLGDGVALLVNERVIERATSIREGAEAIRQNYEMVQELRDELSSVESRLETARDRRDKARRQEDYRSDQFQGEEVIQSLRRRRDALTAVTRNLRREAKRAAQHLRTARRKRENARSALRRAEERFEKHREEMETVTDWERNEATTRELRDDIERQQERFDQWQEKAMSLEETRDDLRSQLARAESELESARDQIEQERQHQRRLESAEERIERYEQEVEALTETRDALREDVRQAEGRIDDAKGRIDYTGRPSDVEEWAERRVERLAGTGGGLFSDEDVALQYLDRLQEDPDRMARLQTFADRYREWADALLQRLRESGILSQEQVDGIRERNEYYAAFNRVEGQEEAFVMGNVNSEAAQSVGGLASDQQVVHRFKGSTRTMRNPLVSLIGQTHAVVTETERNQMLQAFVNPFRSDRTMYDGDVMDLGRIARKATSEDKRTIEVKVQGETEYWQLHPEIYKTMKNIDGVQQESGFIRMLQQAIRFSRNLITYSPAFVTRQLLRDPQEVAIKTESGFKPWENLTYLTSEESREQFMEDVAALESAGGAQFGWHVRGREGYYEQLRSTIEDLAGDSGSVITTFQGVLDTYKRLVEKSEIASRVGDFQRRYNELVADGMDEYDARREAAYETRSLMDFAQGGRAIKQLNKFIPFLNAAVQGMRTAVRAGRENPPGLAWRFMKYGLTAEVGAYVWNALVGGDDALERWRQEPAYLKDFFYTFHIPGAEWTTIRIPKTYEFGLLSSMFVRSAEKGLSLATDGEQGDPDALSGAGRSAKTAFMPLDPAAVASSPGLSLYNVQANWDPFRQRHIVSPYEAKLDLDLREGDQYASRLGQGLQAVGTHTLGNRFAMDARKWDYLIQSLAGGSGRLLTTASDIGRTDQAGREFWMDASGLFINPPVYGSRDVQFVLDWAERRGQMGQPAVERLEDQVDAVYEAEDADTRRARAQKLWEYAGQVRTAIEEGNLSGE
jgi:predicted  nucleic acid-binding Zn-ribbon protein